jgi:hypothetical protein
MQRELRRCSEGILLQLLAVELGVEQQCSDIGDPDLQQLLEAFWDLFGDHRGFHQCAVMTINFPWSKGLPR